MTARRHPFFTSARGRLLSFNLLMGVVTLLVSGVAVFGFHHASQLQEQVQRQTLNDMRGSMDLARDTANVATAAVRLSQVVGALEYKSEAERLLATQQALKHSLAQLAAAPLAQQEQARVANIIRRSNALQQSVAEMLERGQRRHLQRNALLSSLYQNQSNLRHLADLNDRGGDKAIDPRRLAEMDRLIVAAIHTVTPRSIVLQLDQLRGALPTRSADPALAFVLPDVTRELATLAPLSAQLEESDLTISWYMYHIKALVALLNEDINQYVTRVAEASEQRAAQSHRELRSISMFILLSALLALATYSELKNIILVDEDVDIFDSDDILWAMTTRMQGDVSITTIPGIRGHQLDPSQTPEYSPSIRGNGISCKTIFDCTVPWALKSHFERAPFADVDPRPFAPEYFARLEKNQGSAK